LSEKKRIIERVITEHRCSGLRMKNMMNNSIFRLVTFSLTCALSAALQLCLSPHFALAQEDPVFRVPELPDVDPARVQINTDIVERDRSAVPVPSFEDNGAPSSANSYPNPQGSRGNSGNTGSGSGSSPSTIFSGGPITPSPGSPPPNSTQSGPQGQSGGFDVNVSVSGGPQMPILSIPTLPGMPGSPSSSPGSPGGQETMNSSPRSSSKGSSGGGPTNGGSTSNSTSMPGDVIASGQNGSQNSAQSGSTNEGSQGGGSDGSSSNGTLVDSTTNGTSPTVTEKTNGTTAVAGGGSARIRVLDARLEESFGVFDGMIISEREKAQNEANAAGSDVMGSSGAGGSGGADGSGDSDYARVLDEAIVIASSPDSSSGGGMLPEGAKVREGDFAYNEQIVANIPEDIPDASDDDVVARQLREAAMSEPDADLREKLWDEYRRYVGLPTKTDSE
jgi:hypothetical protein